MDGISKIVVSGGILIAWLFVLKGIRLLRSTTLTTAGVWSLVASTAWGLTWFVDQCTGAVSSEFADHAWYASAVLNLCPSIAVLGSRRPGTRVWAWFILFPMLLALGWPVATLWFQGSELRGLQLETPQVLAFCLILIMGVGNYCGTRFTIPALLCGIATAAVVVSSSTVAPAFLSDRTTTRFWSTVLMLLAIGLTKTSTRPAAATKFDCLWFEFFDLFGIVWGRRIQDRVNFIANKEGLPIRLELDGFVWLMSPVGANGSGSLNSATVHDQSLSQSNVTVPQEGTVSNVVQFQDGHAAFKEQIANSREVDLRLEHILRWLLRRFVDPDWIDRRLGHDSQSKLKALSVDS